MNRFKNYALIAAAFTILAAVVSGIAAAPAIAAVIKAALIKNVDERGRISYSDVMSCSAASVCQADGLVIGPNKRLVIEHVTTEVLMQTGMTIQGLELRQSPNEATEEYLSPHFLGPRGPFDVYYANEQPLMYIEAGQKPNIFVFGSGNVVVTAYINGYLIDLTL